MSSESQRRREFAYQTGIAWKKRMPCSRVATTISTSDTFAADEEFDQALSNLQRRMLDARNPGARD